MVEAELGPETRPPVAALLFAHGLAIGTKTLVGAVAPEQAAGIGTVFLTSWLMVHFLAPDMRTGSLKRLVGSGFGIAHRPLSFKLSPRPGQPVSPQL
jgi:hypothetical protein